MSPLQGVLGIAVAFGLVIVLVLKRVNYGLALVLGAVTLGLFFNLSPSGFLEIASYTLTDQITIQLAVIIALIPILAKSLEDTGLMKDFIGGLKGKLSPRIVIATIPAVFGLLPMMGGALLSAPLIDEEATKLRLSPEKKTVINLWFRHIWFYASPLSSTLILLSGLTGVNLYSILLVNLTTFLFHILAGYIFIIRPIANVGKTVSNMDFTSTLLRGSFPIAITILSNIAGAPLPVSLILGIASAFLLGRVGFKKALKTFRDGFQWKLVAAILGVMYFRYVIKFAGVDKFIVSFSKALGIPAYSFLTLVPLMFGFLTAHPSASVVMSAPMAMSAFDTVTPAMLSVLYVSIVVSYNVSPLHLCLVLTAGYFKPKIKDVYRWLIPLFILDYIVGLLTGFALIGLT